jgi:hypothetical protein
VTCGSLASQNGIYLGAVRSEGFLPRLVALSSTGVTRLTGERFLNEDSLESLLEANPELIALDEVDPSAGLLTPIGRQVPLAGQALDLLFVDPSCKLTAVEAKLERNAEVRRQVVAQVLEYGAYLSEWDVQTLEAQAHRYFSGAGTPAKYHGVSLDQVLSTAGEEDVASDRTRMTSAREILAENLAGANMRLVVAVDGVVEPLRKLVSFINTASSFELYLLEVQQYAAPDGLRIASINLFGGSQKRPAQRSARGTWDEERFLEVLQTDATAQAQEVARQLLVFIQEESDAVVWGTGAVEGTAGFAIRTDSLNFTLFWVTTKGSVWMNGAAIHQRVPAALRRALFEYLLSLGVALRASVLADGKWSAFDAAKLQGAEATERFKGLIINMKTALSEDEGPQPSSDGAGGSLGAPAY